MFFEGKKKYIILDIEGNSAQKEEERKMTQFSAITIQDGEMDEINIMNRNVNYISPFARKLTHISVKSCKVNGLSERHMVESIHRLLSSCDQIYAYGCEFDKRILNYMFQKYKFSPLSIPWIDVQEIVKKELHPTRAKLSVAATEYGFDEDNFHNALTDCHATLYLMNVIEKQIQEGVRQ